jgi:hypothetical protein
VHSEIVARDHPSSIAAFWHLHDWTFAASAAKLREIRRLAGDRRSAMARV